MAKKEEKPEYVLAIDKHRKLYSHANVLADTAAHTHAQAYQAAVDKYLMENGEVNFDRLDEAKIQEGFVKTMTDLYVSKAKQHFKVAKDLDDLEKDILMQAYSGTTIQEIKGVVSQYGKKLTHAQFSGLTQQLQRRLSERLYAAAGTHYKEEHVPGMLKEMGLEGKVNANQITLEEARSLMEVKHREGGVSDSALREHVASYKLKKKK